VDCWNGLLMSRRAKDTAQRKRTPLKRKKQHQIPLKSFPYKEKRGGLKKTVTLTQIQHPLPLIN